MKVAAAAMAEASRLPGVVAREGGVPLVIDGKIVGAIGASGGSAAQDGVVASAGLALPMNSS